MVRQGNYRVPRLPEVSLTTSIDGSWKVSSVYSPRLATSEDTNLPSLEKDEELPRDCKEDDSLLANNSGVITFNPNEFQNSAR